MSKNGSILIVAIAYAGLGWVHALSHGHLPLGPGGSGAGHQEHVHTHGPGETHHAGTHERPGLGAFAIDACGDEHGDCGDNHCGLAVSHCHCNTDHCHHEHVVLSTQPREVRRLGQVDLAMTPPARLTDCGDDALCRSALIRPPPHHAGHDHLLHLQTVVLLT